MNSIAEAAPHQQCPPGCGGHLDGDVHISAEQTVVATSGPERAEIYVSLEQAPGQPAAVRLQGAPDTPMSPAQALHLAAQLTAHAFTAVSAWRVIR